MQHPEKIVGEPVWSKMKAIYLEWVRADDYGGDDKLFAPPDEHRVDSVREFLNRVLAGSAKTGLAYREQGRVAPSLDLMLAQFVSLGVPAPDGTAVSLDGLFFTALCLNQVPALLLQASTVESGAEGEAEMEAMLAGARCAQWSVLKRRARSGKNTMALALGLREVFYAELGERTLWSFYRTQLSEHGYRKWWPEASLSTGHRLKAHKLTTASGQVSVRVARYDQDDDVDVVPYEWMAELRLKSSSKVPDAIAYGMVYVLDRAHTGSEEEWLGEEPWSEVGELYSTPSDLRWAADTVADADVSQVLAFLSQHKDAEARMQAGDLCFIWMWERREGAPKGLGVEVLNMAMQDLKARFPLLKTLVVSVQPTQFHAVPLELDPPEVQVAQQEACEQIERLLMAAAPHRLLDGELRLVASKRRTPEETVMALAGAELGYHL